MLSTTLGDIMFFQPSKIVLNLMRRRILILIFTHCIELSSFPNVQVLSVWGTSYSHSSLFSGKIPSALLYLRMSLFPLHHWIIFLLGLEFKVSLSLLSALGNVVPLPFGSVVSDEMPTVNLNPCSLHAPLLDSCF